MIVRKAYSTGAVLSPCWPVLDSIGTGPKGNQMNITTWYTATRAWRRHRSKYTPKQQGHTRGGNPPDGKDQCKNCKQNEAHNTLHGYRSEKLWVGWQGKYAIKENYICEKWGLEPAFITIRIQWFDPGFSFLIPTWRFFSSAQVLAYSNNTRVWYCLCFCICFDPVRTIFFHLEKLPSRQMPK